MRKDLSFLWMPSLFLTHGTPLLALEKNSYTSFLKEYMKGMEKLAAIVILSAHWESEDQISREA
ncbi:hypothetical protein ACQKKK_09575 [Peribacillus sp. NPDC006672]|uniref:hypothetical protein n=1 Tax=Peribacillus sp. NPDC006672 TaxID=3390606 RepID=UPI003D01F7BF